MEAVVDVVTEEIHCTSTGGRVLNMSITGPHGVVSALSNIQAVGTQRWMGKDSYSVSGTVAGANDGDTYNCTASNGVSSATDSVEIRGETNTGKELKWEGGVLRGYTPLNIFGTLHA